MPKIFYLDGAANSLGMLRAIVPLADLAALLSKEVPIYMGRSFAEARENGAPSTLIEIMPEEEQQDWRAGFYRVGKKPLQFEEILRSLRSQLIQSAKESPRHFVGVRSQGRGFRVSDWTNTGSDLSQSARMGNGGST